MSRSAMLIQWIEERQYEREVGAPIGLFSGPHPMLRKPR